MVRSTKEKKETAPKKHMRLKIDKALGIVDKNSKAIFKIVQLLEIAKSEGAKELDKTGQINQRIDVLKSRLNRRLAKMAKWVDAPESERVPLVPIIGRGRPSFAYQPPRQFPTFSQRNILAVGNSSNMPFPGKITSNQSVGPSFDEGNVVFRPSIAVPESSGIPHLSSAAVDLKIEEPKSNVDVNADAADAFVHLQRQIIGNAMVSQTIFSKDSATISNDTTSKTEQLSGK